jgi:malate dehydrogenase
MPNVAIIGAGELGGALAHLLAGRDIVSTIRLIDDRESSAIGKALDIAQAAPIQSFTTRLSGSSDPYSAAGADVIVVADRIGLGEWNGDDALRLLQRIASFEPRAFLVCAGASHRELIERGVRELRLRRSRLLGSAPEALAGSIRALVALEANVSPRDVALTVLGSPPSHIVVPWDQASVGGVGLTRVLDEPPRRRLAARVPALWPPGPCALAAACLNAIECLAGRSTRAICCFVAPDDSSGARRRTVALPVRLGVSGVGEVALPPLDPRDRVALENAMML